MSLLSTPQHHEKNLLPYTNATCYPTLHLCEALLPEAIHFRPVATSPHNLLQSARQEILWGWALMECLRVSKEKAVSVTLSPL